MSKMFVINFAADLAVLILKTLEWFFLVVSEAMEDLFFMLMWILI